MLFLVKLVAVFIIVSGGMYIYKPEIAKQLIDFFAKGKRLYLAGVMRLLLGVLFLYVASECRVPEVMVVVGILCLIGGTAIFILGPYKFDVWLKWWRDRSDFVFRLLGGGTLLFGGVILYSI